MSRRDQTVATRLKRMGIAVGRWAVPQNIRFRIVTWMLATPRRAISYAFVQRDIAENIVGNNTQLVIEAYPRSASTYAATAFRISNEGVRYASHLHSPINVELGIRNQIPVLVLLRDPLDAVTSHLQFSNGLSPRLALRSYIMFYERIVPVADQVVLATFETVVSDFGQVILAVNGKFHTTFRRYNTTPDNERVVRDLINWEDHLFRGSGAQGARTVARPAVERDAQKPALHQRLLSLEGLWAARQVYEQLRPKAI